ncbi:MAG TPA: HIT family protein [Candidatus Magasanikbacteria bacterium]|nr:HIT family protein [Candidatus Magasanikbacteria bacterium]
MDCVFCKIAKKEIPNHTVYEDDQVLAFLDINPCSAGHTVLIPKKHGETVFDFSTELLGNIMIGVEFAMKRIQHVMKPDGFSVGWNHGKAGGQAIPHLHVHLIPRWNTDGGGSMHSIVHQKNMRTVKEVADLFLI